MHLPANLNFCSVKCFFLVTLFLVGQSVHAQNSDPGLPLSDPEAVVRRLDSQDSVLMSSFR